MFPFAKNCGRPLILVVSVGRPIGVAADRMPRQSTASQSAERRQRRRAELYDIR